ncbi:MAG: hypothetical protein AAF498_05060 [Pseudomonadota bacterium]
MSIVLSQQGLDDRIWAANYKQQIDLGFEKSGEYFGFDLLARPIGQSSESYDGHEIILRNSKDTVAVANVIRVHDEACWPLGTHEYLELNGDQISLASIFERSDVKLRMSLAQTARSDFVCIGLASGDVETEGVSAAEVLSKRRARSLGEALISHAGLNRERSHFRAVGLGNTCMPAADPKSTEARNQRAAVVLAVVRRQDISEILDLERVTEALIQNYKTDRIDLSNYHLSGDVARQLASGEIDFAGFV